MRRYIHNTTRGYSERRRNRTGPRYASFVPRTRPFCTTSICPARAKIRPASRVGAMRSRHAAVVMPRRTNPRGISLGQHVFGCLFRSRSSVSRLSVSSSTVATFSAVVFVFGEPCATTAVSSVFRHFALLPASVCGDAAKNSVRILARSPPSSNRTPSASKRRRFVRTLGRSSPHSWPKPPRDRSEATTRCQGTS